MKTRQLALIAILFFSSFAATDVSPTKSELESMYDKAFRSFDANDYPVALEELDKIDARQPDLAESQNLRGVIFMRQGLYEKAEAALYRAVELDPKFWNARFNLAEIPFLQKNWTEARTRFQALLASNSSELQGEATQLIQYKILLTYVLQNKVNMVDSLISKFEISGTTPAVQYGNAAMAFQRGDQNAAKEAVAAAEKNFSPELNKLFAESLYEIGWMEKKDGQRRAALELTSEADRSARAKDYAQNKFNQAEDAFRKRDLADASQLLDEADAAAPNESTHLNLRGEILVEQQNYDEAEKLFQKALKLEPKYREAQYNLAQIPFKKKDYDKARDRLEKLFAATPGGDKNQAAQLIKFKIFMTLLLEGKDSRAQKMMDQFQFTGDTPALYYAQAAWEFQHGNNAKAQDWISSARKIYSLPLNIVFADSFYDAGWLTAPAAGEQPASSQALVAQAEPSVPAAGAPLIEPSPIPGSVSTENSASLNLAPSASPTIAGMEATTSEGDIAAAAAASSPVEAVSSQGTAPAPSPSAVAKAAPPAAKPVKVAQSAPAPVAAPKVVSPASAVVHATPATVLAPARVREYSQPTFGEMLYRVTDSHTLLVVGLFVLGIGLLAWVIVPEIRRRSADSPAFFRSATPATGPSFDLRDDRKDDLSDHAEAPTRSRFAGGPPQRSLQLKATEPSVRRAAIPTGKPGRSVLGELTSASRSNPLSREVKPVAADEVSQPLEGHGAFESVGEIREVEVEETVKADNTVTPAKPERDFPEAFTAATESEPAMREKSATPAPEPIAQGRPVPYQTSVAPASAEKAQPVAPAPALSVAHEPSKFSSPVTSDQPSIRQPIKPMPEPTPSPVIRTAPNAGAPAAPAAASQTAVQLTFSCEIAALQLTPSFKMGALQLKPTSRVVMMRLAPSQQPQPAMNLQVTFEVATVQPSGNSLGTIRLTPSQQQKPGVVTSSAFTIAGVSLVSGSENSPVQLTPSQQGKASVHMTAGFTIATVEFSPSFEIASIVLNATSRQVNVQLPGAGPSSIEGAPVFEISNVQAGGNGEIGLIQLNPGQRRA